MAGNITNIMYRCYPILPVVYDESLSYYEVLCKVSAKLNEVIDFVNDFEADYQGYVDQEIAKLDAKVTQELLDQKAYVDQQIKDMTDAVDAMRVYVDNSIANSQAWVTSKINELTVYINNQIYQLQESIVTLDKTLHDYVDNEIQKLIDMIPEITQPIVIDPITGEKVKLQTALDSIVQYLKYYALTAWEYDSLHLTAQQYDNKKFTALTYDLFAKKYLWIDPNFYMFSPETGEYMLIKDVILQLFRYHKDAPINATEYDALALTATDYDSKALTAHNYDFSGKTMLAA